MSCMQFTTSHVRKADRALYSEGLQLLICVHQSFLNHLQHNHFLHKLKINYRWNLTPLIWIFSRSGPYCWRRCFHQMRVNSNFWNLLVKCRLLKQTDTVNTKGTNETWWWQSHAVGMHSISRDREDRKMETE